jgi:hypothetical protein
MMVKKDSYCVVTPWREREREREREDDTLNDEFL